MLIPQAIVQEGGSGDTTVLFDQTLGADTASIDSGAGGFSTSHALLDVYVVVRTSEAAIRSIVNVTFNNDSGANYYRVGEASGYGGTSVSYSEAFGDTAIILALPGASAVANTSGYIHLTVPAYAGTTFHKVFEVGSGFPTSSSGEGGDQRRSMRWASTSALNRVIVTATSGNLLAGSRLLIVATG